MRILYITYDGLTDPIGQSQILPYLEGCAARGHKIHIISFEKADRRAACHELRERIAKAGLKWTPQTFHSSPPIVSKAYDLWLMERAVRHAIVRYGPFDLLHARSYQAGWVALKIKRETSIPLLFDMRGFWAEQRREGGRWRDASPIGARLYRQWKRREAEMVAGADHVVVLTEAARNEVMSWPSYTGPPVSVIPCCTDFDLFKLPSRTMRDEARARLGFGTHDPVLAYLGSIGTVYRFDAHLRLYDQIRKRDERAKLLHVGAESRDQIVSVAVEAGVTLTDGDVACRKVQRAEVGQWLAAGDVGTAFYTDTYYSAGVSPTKVGEYLACGLPVFSNDAVGDVGALFHELDCGHVMTDFSDASIDAAADRFFHWRDCDRQALRRRARAMFDLPLAVKAYSMIYDSLTPLRLPKD